MTSRNFLRDTELPNNLASLWLQQCEVRYQTYQKLPNSYSCKRERSWTNCFPKAKHFVSFNFGIVQFLEFLGFLLGSSNLDPFLKVYKASEMEGISPNEWFHQPDKLNKEELPCDKTVHNKLRNCKPSEKISRLRKLMCSGLTINFAVVKMGLSEIPTTGAENSSYLQKPTCGSSKQSSHSRKFALVNNKDFVSTLEAMQQMKGFN